MKYDLLALALIVGIGVAIVMVIDTSDVELLDVDED